MLTLTEKQKTALNSLRTGPDAIAIIHFGKLKELGYVERSEGTTAGRGFVGAKLTNAGRAAL